MNKNFTLFVIILVVVIGLYYLLKPSQSDNNQTANQNEQGEVMSEEITTNDDQKTETVEELIIEDVKVGDGKEAKAGDTIEVNYLGTLTDGTKFDSSYDRNQTFSFILGAGQVIKGWDQGVEGMKVGGKRKLTIPSELAYGNRATGSIPANSTLIFEVELLDVE